MINGKTSIFNQQPCLFPKRYKQLSRTTKFTTMDLKIWTKRHFNENSKIEWPCPTCFSNSLNLIKGKLSSEENTASKNFRKENDYWEVDWIELIFNGQIICSNCKETIYFTGIGNPISYQYYDDKLDEYLETYVNTFTPTFFQPFIKLFKIPENCSTELKEEIENSFKLFWCDLQSCANKIRISLEIFLTEQKVKKFEIKNGKRIPISLHKRIEIYNHLEIKDLLLAIKWIGNSGSHVGSLETIDILEAYRLLEFSLNKIYNDESKEIKKISKGIIKRKGPLKRK